MSINVSEVIWTVICFFALLFVLKKFLFGPLVKFMDERQARIDAGEVLRRESEQLMQKNAAALEENWKARSDEAKILLAQSNSNAEALRAQAVAEAQSAAHAAEKEARDRIKAEREETLAQASEKMPELVGVLSDRLMDAAQKQ